MYRANKILIEWVRKMKIETHSAYNMMKMSQNKSFYIEIMQRKSTTILRETLREIKLKLFEFFETFHFFHNSCIFCLSWGSQTDSNPIIQVNAVHATWMNVSTWLLMIYIKCDLLHKKTKILCIDKERKISETGEIFHFWIVAKGLIHFKST